MIFKGLFALLCFQFIFFLTGVVFDKRISDANRILGKIFDYLYIADSFVMLVYVIIFGIYISKQNDYVFLIEGGKYLFYILIVALILGNISKLIVEYFEYLKHSKEKQVNDNVCFIIYLISIFIIFAAVLALLSNDVTYIPDENRNVVEEYEYTDIDISKTIKNNKENFSLIIKDKNDINWALLIDTKHVDSNNSQCKYVKKYKVKEITENCFGDKKENIYYEYIIYTPDERERNIISLYSSFSKNK